MTGHDVLSGQHIDPDIAERARQLRRQMTADERTLWQALRADRLDGVHFRRQQIVSGFIVDFYCHAARLVIELDGSVHAQQIEADADRQRILTGLGLRVLRVTNEEVRQNLAATLTRIQHAVLSRFSMDSPFPRGEGG